MKKFRGFKLNIIFSVLTIFSVISTFALGAYSAYHAQVQSLKNSYLENNEQYANKLAYTTETLLKNMQDDLSKIVKRLEPLSGEALQYELDYMFDIRKNNFNSMLYVDKNLNVLAISSPFSTIKVGDTMKTPGFLDAVKQRKPFISAPYIGATGKMLVLMTVPRFTEAGKFNGMLAGTIYLHEINVLNKTITENFYSNGSFVFVVDGTGQIIYHPDKKRVGQLFNSKNHQKITVSDSGRAILEEDGQELFVGYSHEVYTDWSLNVATPSSIISAPSDILVKDMVVLSFPFFVLILCITLFMAFRLSKPLHKLARFSEHILDKKGDIHTEIPHFKSSIYEVKQLHQSFKQTIIELQHHIHQLDIDIQTDALTGIFNRRTFNLAITNHIQSQSPFALIFLDIDFFKKVNDTYGHLVGDNVLKYLAKMMRELSRDGDLCFRYGGEEFAIIIPNNDHDSAFNVAERLRKKLEVTPSPTGEVIKVSLGIALYPDDGQQESDIIAAADIALYESKSTGRNKTTIYTKKAIDE